MKSTLKQSRSGSLALALLLGLSAAALPAQAQTAGKKARAAKAAATQNAPASSSRSGDYIVAIVNSEPVTNHEVNRRAGMLAQQLRANKVAVPDRATLLRRALNDEILQKAATFSARNSGMTVVVITHNLALIPMGDQVIRVKSGLIDSITENREPLSIDRIEW